MKRILLALVLAIASGAAAQSGDVLGVHDLSSGVNSVRGSMSAACLYCHVPHSGNTKGPLWAQSLSTQTYSLYSSDTIQNKTAQPQLGTSSSLCLSCHDGTVAPGLVIPYGQLNISGKMVSMLGTQLQNSHPFSLQLPMKDAANLLEGFATTGVTGDTTKSVALVKGNLECTSCHNPHAQMVDKRSPNFLVRDNTSGALCLACHTVNPRTVNGQSNSLALWQSGIHANSTSLVTPGASLGGYSTVAEFACSSCHVSHNAGASTGLLRNPVPAVANIDSSSQSCITCHNGGSNISPLAPNVYAEFGKIGHPFASGTNTHDPAEAAILNQNRHATCADCHNAHAAGQVTAFPPPPGTRASQNLVVGVSSTDGVTVVNPSVNQYENCLRCHGSSTGKASGGVFGYLPVWAASAPDQLNVVPQFTTLSTSSHPVTHDRTSPFLQPSLRTYMLNIDGVSQGRSIGARILCTDCHNSDDNREFGGTGPNGPHGSKWNHILERRYEYSQTTTSGSLITNLFPNPDLGVAGPYGLCAKCHDLAQVVANGSFSEHARHINDGFTCSTCHTSHGVGAQSGSISGERLVNFDISVVGSNGGAPITYSRAGNSCTLTCHNHAHGTSGGAAPVGKTPAVK